MYIDAPVWSWQQKLVRGRELLVIHTHTHTSARAHTHTMNVWLSDIIINYATQKQATRAIRSHIRTHR